MVEDEHLYRLIEERVPVPDQGHAVGMMASKVPAERHAELVGWRYPLMGDDDREIELVPQSIGDGWDELRRRIPDLAA